MPEAYDYSGVNWPAVEKGRDVNYRNPHTWSASGYPDIPQDKKITSQGVYDYLYPQDEFIPNPDFMTKQLLSLNELLIGKGGLEQPYIYNKEAGYSHADKLQRFFGLRIPPARYLRNKKYDPYPVKNKKGILSLAAEKIPTPGEIMSLYPFGILEGIMRRSGLGV
jgi:hypothetical protein